MKVQPKIMWQSAVQQKAVEWHSAHYKAMSNTSNKYCSVSLQPAAACPFMPNAIVLKHLFMGECHDSSILGGC